MILMDMTTTSIAYGLLRLALGLNILLHGLVRWRSGRQAFSEALVRDFSNTPLPARWVARFGLGLPVLETAIGVLLTLGLFTQWTLLVGASLMLLLLVGKCLQADWQTASLQLIYVAFYALLIGLLTANQYALDSLFLHSIF